MGRIVGLMVEVEEASTEGKKEDREKVQEEVEKKPKKD